jgi:hypothetical protein
MRARGTIIYDDMVDIAPALMTFFMLAIAIFTFTNNWLFGHLLGLIQMGMPSNIYFYMAIAIAILPLALLRIWSNNMLKAVTYAAWALYIPSVLYFCGIDPLKILDLPVNFGLFSSKLSPVAITIAGIALASGSLTTRSFMYIKNARDNFLSRGADKKEVYGALYRNIFFETKTILASAAAVMLIMIGVPALEKEILVVLKAAGFVYILAGLCAVILLALVFLVYLWPSKKSEKG